MAHVRSLGVTSNVSIGSPKALEQGPTKFSIPLHCGSTAKVGLGKVEDGRGGSGHAATPRFPSPLIEPDVRRYRIRLSDRLHRKAHGEAGRGKRSRASTPRSPWITS